MGDAVHAAPSGQTTAVDERHDSHWLRETWPLDRRDAGVLFGIYVVLTAVFVGVGKLITGPLGDSAIVRGDRDVARFFADRRTESWNTVSDVATFPADTIVKVAVTAVICVTLLFVWKRWLEPLFIALALIIEASAFITITWIVGRPRPDVPKLEDSPVDSSFPSGHTAAAAAYAAIAIVIFWHVRATWVRVLTVIATILLPVGVGLARTYAGMHFLSDVIAGVVLGALSVLSVWLLLRTRRDEATSTA